MGGQAGVDSELGVGSTFWFTARLAKNTSLRGSTPLLASETERTLRERHHGRRILLVDDEPLNLEVAKCLLEDVGLVVDTAVDGNQAVRKIEESSYALVLMDMQMPLLDGVEATRQIRRLSERQEIPILAMTANVFAEDKARCLEAGMNDFLAKPLDPDMLFSSLLKWLDARFG